MKLKFNAVSYWVLLVLMTTMSFARVALADVGGDVLPADVFGDLFHLVGSVKTMQWQIAVASLMTVLVSALKVSAWRPLWDKLGWFKTFLSPLLTIAAMLMTAWATGHLTADSVIVAVTTGAGSVALHEILDGVKGIPGVGAIPLWITGFVSTLLGGKALLPQAKK